MNITGINKNIFTVYDKIAQPADINQTDTAEQSDEKSNEIESVKADIIIKFSDEGKEKSREINLKEELAKMNNMIEMFRQQAEDAKKQGEAIAKEADKQRKCLLIAMRIMCGDKVPIEDQKYLAENSPELYGKAIMLRRTKEKPEEHKRISEDEERTTSVSNFYGERQSTEPIKSAESTGVETVQAAQTESVKTSESVET